MIKVIVASFILFFALFLITGCNSKSGSAPTDSPSQGMIHISADESFKPVIDEQINVYEAMYPGTKIIASYKPEADCFRDFFYDSATRLIIVTRGLHEDEEKYFIDSAGYTPGWNKVATDAIAIIVNVNSTDTLFTIDRLKKQLTGKIKSDQRIVFDGLNATSSVQYIRDSLLQGKQFDTAFVKAAKNTKDVISYVAQNENAIGLVGISWIGNPEDTGQVNLLKKVKIAYVQCMLCNDTPYVKPVQQTIRSGRYPLVRGLYYNIKENYTGLGSGFVSFLKNERGQLIFKRAYLGTIMAFDVRNIKINQTLEQ